MKHLSLLLGVLPIVAAVTTGAQAAEHTFPDARNLTTSIQTIAAPQGIEPGIFNGKSLIDGTSISLAFSDHAQGQQAHDNEGCTWTRPTDWFSPSTSWTNCGTSRNWHTATASVLVLDSLYPLEVGATGSYKRRAVSHTGREQNRITNCTVTDAVNLMRPDKDATPAFVVVCDDSKRVRTTWYSPEFGPVAYRVIHNKNGLQEAWVRTD